MKSRAAEKSNDDNTREHTHPYSYPYPVSRSWFSSTKTILIITINEVLPCKKEFVWRRQIGFWEFRTGDFQKYKNEKNLNYIKKIFLNIYFIPEQIFSHKKNRGWICGKITDIIQI